MNGIILCKINFSNSSENAGGMVNGKLIGL